MGLGGGLLIGSLIGDEIGGLCEAGEEEFGGFFSGEEGAGGGGGGGEEYTGATGGEGAPVAQQWPTAMDFAGQNFMHERTFVGTSYLTA